MVHRDVEVRVEKRGGKDQRDRILLGRARTSRGGERLVKERPQLEVMMWEDEPCSETNFSEKVEQTSYGAIQVENTDRHRRRELDTISNLAFPPLVTRTGWIPSSPDSAS
jgi:hypothetical protein